MAAVPEPVVADVSEVAPASALPELPEVKASPSTTEPTTAPPDGQEAEQAAESKASAAAPAISKAKASKIALSEAPGEVMGISSRSRKGYQAWAVQIMRPDGSIVTGYVDRASGVAFDWVIDQQAPVAAHADDDAHGHEGSDDDD